MLNNPLTRMAVALSIVLACGLLIAVGYFWGSSVSKAEALAEQSRRSTQVAVTALEEVRANANDAMAVEARSVQATESSRRRSDRIADAIREHKQELEKEKPDHEQAPHNVLDGCFVDAVTLGLLDQARGDPREHGGDAASAPDAEVQASEEGAAQASGAQLIEADLELASAYWDLAIRHDELVDWVGSKCSPITP